jgi:hypothetical protein
MLVTRFVAIVLALALPFADGCSAARAAAPPARLAVDIHALLGMPRRQLDAMQTEAERIWKPYGVALRWITDRGGTLPDDAGRLTVVLDAPGFDAAAPHRPLLGAVQFEAGALTANDVVVLSVDTIVGAVMDAVHRGRRVRDWPPAAQHQLGGRAAGRVLAHEIGHYVIAWRGHSDRGLMRASFTPDLLVSAAPADLRVTPLLLGRLHDRLVEIRLGAAAAQARRIIRPQPEVSDGNPAEPARVRPTRPTPLPEPGGRR